MRNLLFVLLLTIFLCVSTVVNAAELPCFVHQTPRFVESGSIVTVTGIPVGNGCLLQFDGAVGMSFVALEYQLQYQPQRGKWVTVKYEKSRYYLDGHINRRPMVDVNGLKDGQYRLITASNGNFLEALRFTVGEVTSDGDSEVPYVQTAAVAMNGHLYFRGSPGRLNVADGYLYQETSPGRTSVIPVEFRKVDSDDLFSHPQIKGGVLDLPWVEVELPGNNGLSPNRSVSACLTTDSGGDTSCFWVYDPTSPLRFDGFTPSSR